MFALAGDSRGQLLLALDELQELVIYGHIGRRVYRFVRRDATHLEAVPTWGRGLNRLP